jgi:hypothetical protein
LDRKAKNESWPFSSSLRFSWRLWRS